MMMDEDQRTETRATDSGGATGSGSAAGQVARFVARHPIGIVQSILYLLIAIIVFQNIEPTSFNVLFWSIPTFPKLILIIVSMLVGAASWELLRRWYGR